MEDISQNTLSLLVEKWQEREEAHGSSKIEILNC